MTSRIYRVTVSVDSYPEPSELVLLFEDFEQATDFYRQNCDPYRKTTFETCTPTWERLT